MHASHTLEKLTRRLLVVSLLVLAVAALYRDRLPPPSWYRLSALTEPAQRPTGKEPFTVRLNQEQYRVEPQFSYELQGVVVSYHDADAFGDIWHHRRWRDFLNIRDLCVVWGDNVASGVYQAMEFKNDSWTCWAYWPDRETGARFHRNQLSNNHLLADRPDVQDALMSARPGDHIQLKGYLATYSNPANGFRRGTSTTREDTGNGACETVYVERFEVVSAANTGMRGLYAASKWLVILTFLGSLLFFLTTPVRL